MFCSHSSSYIYAPFQFLKRYGIKGPQPLPFYGNCKDISKLVCLIDTEVPKIQAIDSIVIKIVFLGSPEVLWESLQKLWTCMWVSSTLQTLKPRLVHMTVAVLLVSYSTDHQQPKWQSMYYTTFVVGSTLVNVPICWWQIRRWSSRWQWRNSTPSWTEKWATFIILYISRHVTWCTIVWHRSFILQTTSFYYSTFMLHGVP